MKKNIAIIPINHDLLFDMLNLSKEFVFLGYNYDPSQQIIYMTVGHDKLPEIQEGKSINKLVLEYKNENGKIKINKYYLNDKEIEL